MIFGYRISGNISRIPIFSTILLLMMVIVFSSFNDITLIPYKNNSIIESVSENRISRISDFENLLSENKGENISNELISLFFSQHLLQFLVEFWIAFLLMTFIEIQIGRIPFIFLYFIFVFVLKFLSSQGIYDSVYPFPWLQGISLMFCGYFYINYFREKIKILYFVAPIESLKGKFEINAILVILPFYFLVQIIIFTIAILQEYMVFMRIGTLLKSVDATGLIAVLHNSLLYLPLPNDGMILNMIICPLAGALIGAVYGQLMRTRYAVKIFQIPDKGSSFFSMKEEDLLKELESRNTDLSAKAAKRLESIFAMRRNMNIFDALYSFYCTNNMEADKMRILKFAMSKFDINENNQEIFDIYLTMKNCEDEQTVNALECREKAAIIKVLHTRNSFEEVRLYMNNLKEEEKNDKYILDLIEYLDKNRFDF